MTKVDAVPTVPSRLPVDKDLALFWFGSIEANTIVAYGTLSKR